MGVSGQVAEKSLSSGWLLFSQREKFFLAFPITAITGDYARSRDLPVGVHKKKAGRLLNGRTCEELPVAAAAQRSA